MKRGYHFGTVFHRFKRDENELVRRIDGNSAATTTSVARRKPAAKTLEVRVAAGIIRRRAA